MRSLCALAYFLIVEKRTQQEAIMQDIAFLAVTIIFFALALGMAHGGANL